ncbi:hypothetical protein E4U42_001840 [Claviceps africana]|uniref:cellulase n=1 Tax=Claviceps africana TaxID=83212 RepID=A0A8K0JA85_9HYPO|nr:hypothetical protein E4U42_001840 [Claviceps africana]
MTWQYITAGQPSSKLDKVNWGNFDKLVQACLVTGAHCMLDLHNFARYNGIIGQGGPSNEVFAALWTNIATHYAKEERIIFGIMNEPHDLDVQLWAKSCQAAVTAIRNAGATSQIILLPGNNFTSAGEFVSGGSAEALAAITNPDGSTDNLVMDLHKYLDTDNSGSHAECVTNNTAAFQTISDWLRTNKRVGIISETGASMAPSCMTKFCEQNEFIAKNDDVLIGFVAWGAGGFDETYILTIMPSKLEDTWTDNKLMQQCILAPFGKHSVSKSATKTKSASPTKNSPSITGSSTAATSTGSHSDDEDGAHQITISKFCILLACISAAHLLY